MKQTRRLLTIVLLFIIPIINGKQVFSSHKVNIVKTQTDLIESVKISKWKYGTQSCVNFSFDDNNITLKKISQIFDPYGFKATFYVISSYMMEDSIKNVLTRGHEIGSHTYSHEELNKVDSSRIEYQIRKGKEMIENAFGIKCLSMSEPQNGKTYLSTSIIFKQHLFIRNYSEYPEITRDRFDCTSTNMGQLMTYLKSSINKGTLFLVVGHGIDGDGYSTGSITKQSLVQAIDSVNSYATKGIVWVTTLKEAACYENLYHELAIDKSMSGDTLIINFKNYNKLKYRDTDSSPISIEIPFTVSNEIHSLTEFTEIKKLTDKYIVTSDLKRDTSLVLIINTKLTQINHNSLKQQKGNLLNSISKFEISIADINNWNERKRMLLTIN